MYGLAAIDLAMARNDRVRRDGIHHFPQRGAIASNITRSCPRNGACTENQIGGPRDFFLGQIDNTVVR